MTPFEDAMAAEAAKSWRLAADQGDPGAQFNLGIMYETGLGVSQDYVLSHMWFDLAARYLNCSSRQWSCRSWGQRSGPHLNERLRQQFYLFV